MELSNRLKIIASHVDNCNSVADIGTDHGYIPIYLLKQQVCEKAIASDINKGPLEKAKLNVSFENLSDKIKCLLGPGLVPLKQGEVNGVIIAGMGGNLIRDILLADIKKVKLYDFLILQPAQNPEVLREYLYNNGYKIIDEDLIKEDRKYYELFKVRYDEKSKINIINNIDYEISPILKSKNHPLIKAYMESKIEKYSNILKYIKDDTKLAREKKQLLKDKVSKIREMI